MTQSINIYPENSGQRIDQLLASRLQDISRSQIQRFITDEHVKVNNKTIKPHYKVKEGDEVVVTFPPSEPPENLEPENIPLDIIFEDSDIIVINKKSGMTVHPAPGNQKGTVAGALLYYCTDLSGISGVTRPGIVHRLDKDTSGVLVCAKNNKSHLSLSSQFQDRKVTKFYTALVKSRIKKDTDKIDINIGRHVSDRKKYSTVTRKGKSAVTIYEVISRFNASSLLKVQILTGRTHQIRVHLAHIGHPIIGDPIYGAKKGDGVKVKIPHLMLHATTIGFTHPTTGQYVEFSAPLAKEFQEVLEKIK